MGALSLMNNGCAALKDAAAGTLTNTIINKMNERLTRTGVLYCSDDALFTYNSGTKDRIDIPAFSYQISGQTYYSPKQAAVDWDEGGETINTGAAASTLWGAWYLTINAAGTVTATPMDQSGDMAYATEFAALCSINGNSDNTSLPAGECLFGILTVQVKASQTFTADTTEFDNSTVINAYNFYFIRGLNDGVTAAAGTSAEGRVVTAHTALAVHSTPEQYALTGTAVAYLRGQATSLAAGSGKTFTVNDTINTGTAAGSFFGGWLVLRDAAGNCYTLGAGGSEVAADQVYASAAAVQTALDALFIPPLYAKVGQIVIEATEDEAWTANTDDMTDESDCEAATLTVMGAATAYTSTNTDSAITAAAPTALT